MKNLRDDRIVIVIVLTDLSRTMSLIANDVLISYIV